jgi:Ca2+-binding EF-hand superfamily protein
VTAEWLADLINKNSNNWNLIWRSVQGLDKDKNGFLEIDELEGCFREYFPYEMEGKSIAHFSRQFSTDHDKNMVNYRKIKAGILVHR